MDCASGPSPGVDANEGKDEVAKEFDIHFVKICCVSSC